MSDPRSSGQPFPSLDPVTVEVLWTRLISVIDEAALTLHRTSFSTVVREAHDYTCMILDPAGQAVAQATRSIPAFIGTLPLSARAFLRKYPVETLRPGDVLISNDPWIGTGHLPDLTMAAPIFQGDRMVGLGGVIAHLSDVGGRRRAPDNKDIYEEGLQIPILKLYEAGRLNHTLMEMIRQNVRVPDEVAGDMHAMVGACEKMHNGVTGLLDEYAMPDIQEISDTIIELTRKSMCRAVAAVPDGLYRTVTPVDSFDTRNPLEIHCAMEVSGEKMKVDFAGTSVQSQTSLNSVLGYTQAYSAYALKCVLLPDVPNNEGNILPLTITAPEGCFLNPRYPAAVEARATAGQYCTSAIFNTLAEAIPDRIPAECGIPMYGFNMSGRINDRPFSTTLFLNGGQGAGPDRDGVSTLSFPSNVSTTPLEILERSIPVRIREKAFLPGSGGAGQFKGGLGQRVVMEIVGSDTVNVVLLSQRLNFPPRGRQGGENGSLQHASLNDKPVEADTTYRLSQGDVIVLDLPGGGGFGRAADRDTHRVDADREDGFAQESGRDGAVESMP